MRKRWRGVAHGEPTRAAAAIPDHGPERIAQVVQWSDVDAGALARSTLAAIRIRMWRSIGDLLLCRGEPLKGRRLQWLFHLMARR